MTNKPHILLVEDNPEIGPFVAMELECEGYQVTLVTDGIKGLTEFRHREPDLAILDWEIPKMNGLEVCRRIRQSSHVPILILTSKSDVAEKIQGLDAGANDYIVKPFELDELLARVRAQLRLVQKKDLPCLVFQGLEINLQTHQAVLAEQRLDLSPKEFELLRYLMQHPRQVLTKSRIYEAVWGWDSDHNENNVEVYVSGLRQKLEQNGQPRLIHTRRGSGYILIENA